MMADRAVREEEVTYDNQEAYRYSDGSIRNANGHWLAKPPGSAVVIDNVRSQELHERKAAKRLVQQQDAEAEVQRALVSQVAGAATPARAYGKLAGNLVAELAAEDSSGNPTSPKEHGLKNYTGALDWIGKQSGLIEEKTATHDNRSVNIESITLAPDVKEHVAMLLAKLSE